MKKKIQPKLTAASPSPSPSPTMLHGLSPEPTITKHFERKLYLFETKEEINPTEVVGYFYKLIRFK